MKFLKILGTEFLQAFFINLSLMLKIIIGDQIWVHTNSIKI